MNRFTICIAVADPLRSSKLEMILAEDGCDAVSFRTANDYSIKPVSPFQVRARVRAGLRGLQYIDSITSASAPPAGAA